MIYMYVLKLGVKSVWWLRGFLNAEGNKRDEFGEFSRGPRVMWVLHVTGDQDEINKNLEDDQDTDLI